MSVSQIHKGEVLQNHAASRLSLSTAEATTLMFPTRPERLLDRLLNSLLGSVSFVTTPSFGNSRTPLKQIKVNFEKAYCCFIVALVYIACEAQVSILDIPNTDHDAHGDRRPKVASLRLALVTEKY